MSPYYIFDGSLPGLTGKTKYLISPNPYTEAAFDINSLSPHAWYDAGYSGDLTLNGDKVTDWADRSGNAYTLSQTTDSLRPSKEAAAQNSLDTITAPTVVNNHNYLEATGLSSSGNGTIVTLFRRDGSASNGNNNATMPGAGTNGSGTTSGDRIFQISWSGTSSPYSCAFIVFDDTSNGSAAIDVPDTNFHIWTYRWTYGTNVEAWLDGDIANKVTASLASEKTAGAVNNLRLFGSNFSTLFFMVGSIASFMYFPKLSDSDCEKAEGFAAHRWGLEGNLPAGHTYKSSPP